MHMEPPRRMILLGSESAPQTADFGALLAAAAAMDKQLVVSRDRAEIVTLCQSHSIQSIVLDADAIQFNVAELQHSLQTQLSGHPPPLFVVGEANIAAAVAAIKAGAADYFVKTEVTAEAWMDAMQSTPSPPIKGSPTPQATPVTVASPCHQLADALPQIIWSADASGQVTYWNQHWYEYTRLSPAASMGTAGAQIIHPEERDRTLRLWQQSIQEQRTFQIEYRMRRWDGIYRWFLCRALPTYDATRQLTGWVGTIADIDAQKRLEQQLLREVQQRRATERALRLANRRVTGILESMSDAFIALDPNWRLTYINQVALAMNQVADPADLIGKSYWELWPDVLGTFAEAEYRRAIATQTPAHFEYFYAARERWYEIHAYPSLEGLGIYFRDIHARKQAELDDQRSTAILEAFMAASPMALALFDRDLRVIYANQAAELNHQPLQSFLGKTLAEVAPCLADQLAPLLQQVMATETPLLHRELDREIDAGEVGRLIANHYPVCLPGGEVIGVGMAAMDMSDLKRTKTALAAEKERYRYIFEAVNVAIWEADFSAVKAAIEQLKQTGVTDFERYFTEHPEFVQQAVETVQLRNVNQAALRMFGASTKAQFLTAFNQVFTAETRPVFARKLQAIATDAPFFAAAATMQTLRGDRLHVWVNITFPPARESYNRVLISLLDTTEQQRTDIALQESEDRFRTLADNISQFTWMADASGWIFWFNRRWFEYTGTTLEEMQGWGWRQVHHPDHVDRVVAKISHCFRTGEPWEDTFPLRGRQGEYRWFLSRALPIRDDFGNILQWFGSNTDITELKQAEAALANNEARLRGFVEANVVGILYGDIYGRISEANDELLRIIGYSRQDLEMGQLNWMGLTPPEFLSIDEQAFAEARERGACTPYEKEYIRQDGSRIPVLIGYSLVGDEQTETVVFVLDLSARKQAERALHRSQDRLRIAIEAAQLGTWDWDLITQELTWDDRCKVLFGLPPDAEINVDTFFAGLHPDDRERLEQAIAVAQDPTTGGDYDAEFRTIGQTDGVERWLAAKGKVYFTPENTPRRFTGTLLDITERKQAEQAIRESEERLQMALEGASGGLWDWHIATDEDFLSPRWLEMLGYAPGELPNLRESWEQLIHPEDKPWVLERLQAHLEDSSVPYKFEYRLLSKSGEWKWISNHGKVVKRDHQGRPVRMSGIHHDVSDHKLMEENLRQSENRYRTLANAVSQLMWINDTQGNIEFYNQQWNVYTGIEELPLGVGLWRQVIHPDDFHQATAVRQQAIQAGEAYEVECRLLRHDHSYRWHLARIVPLKNEQGDVLSWFGTATDIHDRKCAAAEREQLLVREKAAREEAERANRIKDEFLAILSHELRSPLNPILGWSKLLQTRSFDAEKTNQALATIERNAKLQTQLIDDLLDIAKILRGKLRLENAAVSVAKAMEAAIETIRTAAAAKAITVRANIVDDVKIWGDAGRLQQIIWNLLSNAIKFTPEQGNVEIRLQQVQNCAQITVTDTGKGISPNFLPHIFKSFQQEDVSITRKHGGLGLGLAIVRYLVEAHGGTIAADSPGEGLGATFTIELPLLNQDLHDAETPNTAVDMFDLSGIRVLAIDDNLDACELLDNLLSQYGAEVKTVTAATEGLEMLPDYRPHVLVSDVGMPDLDGFSLIRQIRDLSPARGGRIPAIALTAYTREIDQRRAYESGYQIHLPKPIEIERLVRSIVTLVRK